MGTFRMLFGALVMAGAGANAGAAVQIAAPTPSELPRYRLESIGSSLDGIEMTDLNNNGQVLGSRVFEDEVRARFIYSQGRFERLPAELVGAIDLNDHGDIASRAMGPGGAVFGAIYRDGRIIGIGGDLGDPSRVFVRTINNQGHALGSIDGRPFLYDGRNSRFVEHPAFTSGRPTFPEGFNDHGMFIGDATDEHGERYGFLFNGGTLTRIPSVEGVPSFHAEGLNNAGQVVGISYSPEGATRAVLYSGGVSTDLGSLGGVTPDGIAAQAIDINDHGWIVGDAITASLDMEGFVYLDGRMHGLNGLLAPSAAGLWNVYGGFSINNRGQILASAVNAGDRLSHVVLLTPVPEPGSWALMLAGLGVAGAAVRYRRPVASSAAGRTLRRASAA